MAKKIIVLALGGNALAKKSTSIDSQYRYMKRATKQIASLVKEGHQIVITHGNGPQVGDALLRNEYSRNLVPSLPLHACVAGTQGVLGSMLQAALLNDLGLDCKIACVITKVKISPKDPSFKNPLKQIGSVFTSEKIKMIKKLEPSAIFKEIQPGKHRRVVPSPNPISVLDSSSIKNLLKKGYVVIACGGGGIPVTDENKIKFVDAVIDKDLSSEVLATEIGASLLVILTDVDGVYVDFKTRNKKLLKKTHVDTMEELLKGQNFEAGSIEPKVKAAIRFTLNTGNKAVIASLQKTKQAVNLKSGTIIYK